MGNWYTEEATMLYEEYYRVRLSEFDQQVFRAFVPPNHPLRKALPLIAWQEFYPILAPYYSPDQGQPAINPVLMLKLEFLRSQFNLSDGQVIERSKTDLAFRYFLQIRNYERLPDPSSLSVFRGRLGKEGFRAVFDQLVAMARAQGLVKDRLRIKDASHVIANIAVPSTLALVAQIRDKLLAAAEPFDALRTEGERVNIELLHERTAGGNQEQRLLARVTHLREILAGVDQLVPPEDATTNCGWQMLLERRGLAHKILADQEAAEATDCTCSTVDPDARRSKHGEWFDGFKVDILEDADSELITQINVLPANGDEAIDAVDLVRQEEAAHGNDVQALSIDGVGFNGTVLRELEDPEGLAVNTFVPPKKEAASTTFTPADFVENAERSSVTCPAGQTSRYRQRDSKGRGWMHRFARESCEDCPLIARCLDHPPRGPFGRTVRKTDYEVEYGRAREKATTAEYAAVRAENPASSHFGRLKAGLQRGEITRTDRKNRADRVRGRGGRVGSGDADRCRGQGRRHGGRFGRLCRSYALRIGVAGEPRVFVADPGRGWFRCRSRLSPNRSRTRGRTPPSVGLCKL